MRNDWVTVQLTGAHEIPLDTFSVYLGSDATQRDRTLSAVMGLPLAPVSATTLQKLQAPQPARSGPICLVYWRSIGEFDAPTTIDELHTRYWSVVLYSVGVTVVGVGLTTQSGYSQWVSIQ